MFHYIVVLATFVHFGCSQILPGTVPSLPNPTLEGCQKDASSLNSTSNFTSPYAKVIDSWCGVYDDVLPCVDMSLPYTRMTDVNDWYLSLIFDMDKAYNVSEEMCMDWETYADDMVCIERSRRASSRCIKFQTNPLSQIILQLYYTNTTDNAYADVNACLYANYTATCIVKHMRHCSEPVRKIIHQYYSILSGKCEAILLENAEEQKNKTLEAAAKRQKKAEQFKAIIEARRQAQLLLATQTPSVNSGNDTFLDESATNDTLTLEQQLDTGNGTSTILRKKKKKNKKRKKVKAELKKLLGFVMLNL